MPDIKLGLNQFKIPSLTEWMEKIKFPKILEFRHEDNYKYDRLKKLHQIIGINYNVPEKIAIKDIVDKTDKFLALCKNKTNTTCNFRLIPRTPVYPKLRIRAVDFQTGLKWLKKTKFNSKHYKELEIIKYNHKIVGSAIFLINDLGVWGETLNGDLWRLAYGVHARAPSVFTFNYKRWYFSRNNPAMISIIKNTIRQLRIDDETQREQMRIELDAHFTKEGYLKGYFEFVVWPEDGVLYMDYNRVITNLLQNFDMTINYKTGTELSGVCACPGMAFGTAKIITDPLHPVQFNNGDILISNITTIDHVPLMKKARAIIIEQGNLLSHAAIVSRELHKPCIILAKDITKKLKNGDNIFVDATAGTITLL